VVSYWNYPKYELFRKYITRF